MLTHVIHRAIYQFIVFHFPLDVWVQLERLLIATHRLVVETFTLIVDPLEEQRFGVVGTIGVLQNNITVNVGQNNVETTETFRTISSSVRLT